MKRELFLKVSIIFTTLIMLTIGSIVPFSINADSYPVAPFVGINWYVQSYDNEYNVSLGNGTGTLNITDGAIAMGSYTGTNGKTYWSTGMAPGDGLDISGTISLTQTSSSTRIVKRVIHVDIILDNDYVGYIKPRVYDGSVTYFQQELAVNGNIISFQFVDDKIADDVLYSINLSNIYLTKNNNNERWNFPIESYAVINQQFENNYFPVGINQYNDYFYPIFETGGSRQLLKLWSNYNGQISYLIMGTRWNSNNTTFYNYFEIQNGELAGSEEINFSDTMTFKKYVIRSTVANNNIVLKSKSNFKFIPIWWNNDTKFKYLSTDFALNWALTNPLLDKLEILANGTQQSNQSSSNADNTNSQASQVFSQEEQLVNNAEQNLQDNLNNLDIQNKNNNLFGNSKFIASANWVKTQFNTLTNNNAFGYLITFSLVIGLALVIIGKLRG